MSAPTPSFLADQKLRLLLFGGKGGVGKTSCATFVRAPGRTPSDFEWYVLWNAPGAFARVSYAACGLSPGVQARALRFSNLLRSRPPDGRNNKTREERKAPK